MIIDAAQAGPSRETAPAGFLSAAHAQEIINGRWWLERSGIPVFDFPAIPRLEFSRNTSRIENCLIRRIEGGLK